VVSDAKIREDERVRSRKCFAEVVSDRERLTAVVARTQRSGLRSCRRDFRSGVRRRQQKRQIHCVS